VAARSAIATKSVIVTNKVVAARSAKNRAVVANREVVVNREVAAKSAAAKKAADDKLRKGTAKALGDCAWMMSGGRQLPPFSNSIDDGQLALMLATANPV
jgi:hypothetical protein